MGMDATMFIHDISNDMGFATVPIEQISEQFMVSGKKY